MSILNEIGIERWRPRSDLPGAKRESYTHVCLFSDSTGPRLRVSHPASSRLFNNFCRAVAVVYRFEMTSVSVEKLQSLQDVPSVHISDDEHKSKWWESLTHKMI